MLSKQNGQQLWCWTEAWGKANSFGSAQPHVCAALRGFSSCADSPHRGGGDFLKTALPGLRLLPPLSPVPTPNFQKFT